MSKTPIIFEEYGICKNTKQWKNLKNERIAQLDDLKIKLDKIVPDIKLRTELLDKISTLEYNVKDWWSD
jgi:hypothetical protein